MSITRCLVFFCALLAATIARGAQPLTDRFVWVFGWGLDKDSDLPEVDRVLETGGRHGFNGAVFSAGLDTLCQKTPDYFRRLEGLQALCQSNHLELIPAIFSIGYGGGALAHNRNLAEGLPVEDAPFLVEGEVAASRRRRARRACSTEGSRSSRATG